ncbi:MAG: polysulfide reductase NrfD [Bacteroidia bacterium]|nr:polysulfide reductase NrfD [Bacteroidia bacterium]MCX7652853.1 polysulfide reductase NrfD [Bacteroidia bacterium]MDW8417601.1 NrfD/PsrC family molybdoenzyme membrane anchor subunit [Bacteroidia bacterium]
MFESPIREPLITGRKTYRKITDDLVAPILGPASWKWYVTTAFTAGVMFAGFGAIAYTLWVGIGTWGLNKTVGWAFDITNFVFWIGIGHAGTLISAILLLFRQRWRMAINRAAEAMTIFAVICAGLFPIIHMGRPWLAFWFLPLPNTHGSLWVNFNSPLLWDVFAISTYFTISLLFWYTGLIPDLAMVRDRAKPGSFAHAVYSLLSFGWTGSAKQWQRFEAVSLVLAGLSTPLVLSVHSIVSFDFATSILPGWHTTIFPPYFVAGAIFSGFGMVLTLMIITREVLDLKDYITLEHIDAMAKVTLATGMMVGFAYATEFFIAWYSGSYWERYIFLNRAFGPYWWSYWAMVSCNLFIPQVFWFKKLRRSPWFVFIISIFVNIGMWFERFVIIVTSLHRDFLASSWRMYAPTWVEVTIFVGTFGLFLTLYLLFARYLPVIAAAETKSILKTSGDQYAGLAWEAYQAQKRQGSVSPALQPAMDADTPKS